MLNLNIIPEEIKKTIKLINFYKSYKRILLILFLIITIYAIVFLFDKLILQNHFVETVSRTTLLTKTTENYSKNVREINNQINFISNIQDNFINWSYLIDFIAKNTPDGINFKQIKFNKDKNSLFLQGKAANRDNLLALKKILESKPEFFSNISFPIKNILEKNNINFEINVSVNSYEFEQLN
ncbi:hypothetical protein K8R32_01400 [bacterium]|nr:hypothetical protein [bacterium]